MSAGAIRHRLANGRLHRLATGVYAVGRPAVGVLGKWMGATLACGPHSLLSHRSAAALWGIQRRTPGAEEVVIPPPLTRRRDGIRVHRIAAPPSARPRDERDDEAVVFGPPQRRWLYATRVNGIPVTGPIVTIVDLASSLPAGQVESAVSEADHRDLVDPETLRQALDWLPYRPGCRTLRHLLDRASYVMTTTELERRFLPLVSDAGLPLPGGQERVGKHRVDFLWPELDLAVETDSLRYHRNAFEQAADKRRDNANMRRGLATLRFTHGQIRFEQAYVRAELRGIAAVLRARR